MSEKTTDVDDMSEEELTTELGRTERQMYQLQKRRSKVLEALGINE